MADPESVPLRDILNKVSTNVDDLTRLMHTHIERMVSQQDGMKRLGEKSDNQDQRLRALEISSASTAPQNKSTSDGVRLVIVLILTVVLTTGLNRMFDRQQVSTQGAGNANTSVGP